MQAYAKEIGFEIEPASFVDHWTARDWLVAKGVPLIDWKAMLRTWQESRRSLAKQKVSGGFASLGALQMQLKLVEAEIGDILYPGGCAFRAIPSGKKADRYSELVRQRWSLKDRIDKF